jgi:hypothetical protein
VLPQWKTRSVVSENVGFLHLILTSSASPDFSVHDSVKVDGENEDMGNRIPLHLARPHQLLLSNANFLHVENW